MRFLADYIMRGRLQATLVTSVCAILALALPPFGYLSGAAVGLVTLRAGAAQGAVVIFSAALVSAALGMLLLQAPLAGAVFALLLWLPVWVAANSLRRRVQLAHSLWLAGLFGALVVVGMHAVVADPAAWWRDMLLQALAEAAPDQPLLPDMMQALDEVGQFMTGVAGAAAGLGVILSLFIARWWQATLYNPGGFRQEFHGLRLGRLGAGITLLLTIAALISLEIPRPVLDMVPVALLLYMLQGMAVVHGLVATTSAGIGWLVAMYAMLVLPMVMPQTALTLALAGVLDNWFDFRRYFGAKGKNGSDGA